MIGPAAGDAIDDRLVTAVDEAEPDVVHTARRLRLDLGWQSRVCGDELLLDLGAEVAGIRMPRRVAVRVLAELAQDGAGCPALAVADGSCILLVNPFGRPDSEFDRPAVALPAGTAVALPQDNEGTGWLSPPVRFDVRLATPSDIAAAVRRAGVISAGDFSDNRRHDNAASLVPAA